MKFVKQLLNARWKQKSKVKIKGSKLLYKPKWTVMRFGDLLILTASRCVITNVISFGISSKRRSAIIYEHEFKLTNLKFSKITNKINE